jgi:pyruvyltransferase
MTKPLKLYWSSGLKNGKKNFGDWLSPVLCEAISGRKVVYAKPNCCDLVSIGSILHRLKNHFWTRPVNVWGSGLIEEIPPFKTRHKIHAVRGHLTAKAITNCKPQAFGDPGLLCNILLPSSRSIKSNKVGLIPHYKDQQNSSIKELSKQPGIIIIDIFSDTLDFIEQVNKCHYILSSSLHGLIVADALNIPNGWIKLSGKVRGNDFKFSDYYSIFGLSDLVPMNLTEKTNIIDIETWCSNYKRPAIDQIKENLYNSFPGNV